MESTVLQGQDRLHLTGCLSFYTYCTFNKVRDASLQQAYVDALVREIRWYGSRPTLAAVEVSSVYFGGGTPRCLPAEWIARILEELRGSFCLRPHVQITLEGNPDSLEAPKLVQYTPEDFTKSGVRCQYQVDVWQPPVKRFLGFGAGVLSTFGDHHWSNLGQLEAYLDAVSRDPPALASLASRSQAHQIRDYFLYSAKTLRFDADVFRAQFGVHPRTVVGGLPEVAWLVG